MAGRLTAVAGDLAIMSVAPRLAAAATFGCVRSQAMCGQRQMWCTARIPHAEPVRKCPALQYKQ
eukprot:362387-Chlamydomonas_euryale.AAC.13